MKIIPLDFITKISYHSFHKLSNVYIYGPGYPNYSIEDCFDDVLAKLSIKLATSWI